MARGKEYFEQAIRLDPNYAPAYVGVAYYYVVAEEFFLSPKDAMPPGKAAAEKAVDLDEALAEAHIQLALAYYGYDWNWPARQKPSCNVRFSSTRIVLHRMRVLATILSQWDVSMKALPSRNERWNWTHFL